MPKEVWRVKRLTRCSMLILFIFILSKGFAGEVKEPHKDKIMDNSFLIEEAYNQEDGVVQHIQAFQYLEKTKTWGYTFTQEIPVPGQKHQLSSIIPVNHLGDPVNKADIGDITLNYRYQLNTLCFKDNYEQRF